MSRTIISIYVYVNTILDSYNINMLQYFDNQNGYVYIK